MTLVLRGGGVSAEPLSFTLQVHTLRGVDPITIRGEELPATSTTLIPDAIDDSAIGDPVIVLPLFAVIPDGIAAPDEFGDPYITLAVRPAAIQQFEDDVGAPIVSTDSQAFILRRSSGGGHLRVGDVGHPAHVLRAPNLFTTVVMPDAFFPEHEVLSNPLGTDFGMPEALIVAIGEPPIDPGEPGGPPIEITRRHERRRVRVLFTRPYG